MPKTWNNYGPKNPEANRWMWAGVITFTVIIIALWGYAFKTKMAGLKWRQSQEYQLTKETKTNWDQAFAKSQAEIEQSAAARAQLKSLIQQLATYQSATTSSSSTISTTTSTTSTKK